MPQNPFAAFASAIFKATGAPTPAFALLNAQGEALNTNGGKFALLDIGFPVAVKVGATKLAKIIVIAPGASGSLQLNDAAVLSAANLGNAIFNIVFNTTGYAAGSIYTPEVPCLQGLMVSQVPQGGQVLVLYS